MARFKMPDGGPTEEEFQDALGVINQYLVVECLNQDTDLTSISLETDGGDVSLIWGAGPSAPSVAAAGEALVGLRSLAKKLAGTRFREELDGEFDG